MRWEVVYGVRELGASSGVTHRKSLVVEANSLEEADAKFRKQLKGKFDLAVRVSITEIAPEDSGPTDPVAHARDFVLTQRKPEEP